MNGFAEFCFICKKQLISEDFPWFLYQIKKYVECNWNQRNPDWKFEQQEKASPKEQQNN